MKAIRIECEGSVNVPLSKLVPSQGNLKELPKENYEKFKREILQDGFSEPILIWKSPDGVHKVANGHQRLTTLLKMTKEEGFTLPKGEVPCSIVKAKDEKELHRKILGLASNYGKVSKDGLFEFLIESDIDPDLLATDFDLPGIDTDDFLEKYFSDLDEADELDVSKMVEKPKTDEPKEQGNHVKMVQLFLTQEQHQSFTEKCKSMFERFKTDNITDTIIACVNETYEQGISKKEA